MVERENECDDLFEEIKNGNGGNSLRYLALRDACKELRKGIFRSAMSTGLTRESISMEIKKVEAPVTIGTHEADVGRISRINRFLTTGTSMPINLQLDRILQTNSSLDVRKL